MQKDVSYYRKNGYKKKYYYNLNIKHKMIRYSSTAEQEGCFRWKMNTGK